MIDKEIFLSSYYLDENDIEKANVTWDELDLIQADYSELERHLRELGKEFIDTYLYEIDKAGIHSYRYRVKSSAHLLEKVIRKKKENPEKFAILDHTNYHKMVTDLVGIRVSLFEEGWAEIDHDIVYPFYQDDEMLKDFSKLLNRLAGSADEMSSYFRKMKQNKEEK